MSNFIKDKIQSLSNEQLHQCFTEIEGYNKKGTMGDTLVRQIRNELAESINDESWDVSCVLVVIPEILYEIARRYYNNQ